MDITGMNAITRKAEQFMQRRDYDNAQRLYQMAEEYAKDSPSSLIRTMYDTKILPTLRHLEERSRVPFGCYCFEGGIRLRE